MVLAARDCIMCIRIYMRGIWVYDSLISALGYKHQSCTPLPPETSGKSV